MEQEERDFFKKKPQMYPLYEAFKERMRRELGPFDIRVQKTQIAFSNKHNFAFVWLPFRKAKGKPDAYLIVTFGLGHQVISSTIDEQVEPYPNRWTNHVLIQDADGITDQLMDWIKEAYEFSMTK